MSNITGPVHYSQEEWVDFVRSAVPRDRHEAMQRHLATGCQSCREAQETWRRVLAIARDESSFEPPAGAMRLARAVYVATKLQGGLAFARAAPKLIFDSRLAAVPAGIRTLRPGPRKLLYEAEECLLDLQLDPLNDRAKVVLIGQVIQPDTHTPHIAGLPVLLLRQTKLVERTKTNAFGEFRLEFDGTSHDLSLAVGLSDTAMVIELGDLI